MVKHNGFWQESGQVPLFRDSGIRDQQDNGGSLFLQRRREEAPDFKGKYEYGDTVSLKINQIVKKAKYVTNLFGDVPGELVIYPGSSGKKDNRFLEISIWRHFTEDKPTTGIDEFNSPKVGSVIELIKNW